MNPWNTLMRLWPAVIVAAFTPPILMSARVCAAQGVPGNGIAFVALDHPVADSLDGSSLNVISGVVDDSGPTSGDWDFNFFDDGTNGLTLRTIDTYATEFVVDAAGNVAVLSPATTIGPASSFSSVTGGPVPAPALRAGVHGYVGVRFHCDGRLPIHVPSGVCYGYIALATTAPAGFPATLEAASYDGDGNAIQIPGSSGPPTNPPSMVVAPSSLSFSVAANAVDFKAFDVSNAKGSDPLIVHLSTQDADGAAVAKAAGPASSDSGRHGNASSSSTSAGAKIGAASPKSVLAGNGSIQFTLDDGSIEAAYGYGFLQPPRPFAEAAVFINRFSASQAMTIDSISIYWPDSSLAQTDLTGKQIDLVAYYDANATGDPTNAVRLGSDDIVSVDGTDAFQTFATSFGVPGAGDLYIGFVDYYDAVFVPPEPYPSHPAAVDTTSPQQQSYVSLPATGATVDWNNLANNAQTGTLDSITGDNPAGNFMIRATATPGGGGGASCSPTPVSWLTLSPTDFQINLGDLDVLVTVNPVAGSLSPGTYTASICLNSNDPANPIVSVPVSLTVNEIPCQASDEIFCGMFDPQVVGASQPGVYTTRDAFLAQVSNGYYENGFDSVPADSAPSAALQFSDPASGISYTIDSIAHHDELWNGAGYISTNWGEDALLITFAGAPVTAVGGNFFAGNSYFNEVLVGNTITITLSDGTVESLTTQSAADFRGFTTSIPIHSIIIDAPDPGHLFDNSWSTMDNLIVGSAK